MVLEGVKAKIEELNRSILPKGVQLVPYYDRAWLIDNTLKTVFKNLAEGAVLVCLVLFLFLGRIRPAAIVAVVIPLSLLATFIGLKIKGIPANLLSLGAMDFGIIVDGAVIVVENIFRRVSHEREKFGSFKELVAEAASEVGRPTFFSMLIIIIAHVPIFTLQRHEGRIFAPMAYTITSALIGSLLFSLTLVPVLCVYLLRRSPPEKENILVRVGAQDLSNRPEGRAGATRMVLLASAGALVGTLLSSSEAWLRVSSGTERREHLDQLHLASRHITRGGEPFSAQGSRRTAKNSRGLSRRLSSRPARRWHRPEADQHDGNAG